MYGTSPRCAARIARRNLVNRPLLARRAASSLVCGATQPPARARPSSLSAVHRLTAASRRKYSTEQQDAQGKEQSVAILGGGMTGLTTAFYLSKNAPSMKITLYEAADRLGGWADTERVPVKSIDGQEGTVLWERGPRTILTQHNKAKWDDLIFYELVHALGLQEDIGVIPQSVRMKRFIYYPDHLVDITEPAISRQNLSMSAFNLLKYGYKVMTEPLFRGAPQTAWHMISNMGNVANQRTRPSGGGEGLWTFDCQDVSIGDFWSKMFGGRELVDNVLSAMLHGIYGGNVWDLSMESSMFQSHLMTAQASNEPGDMWVLLEDHALAEAFKSGKDHEAVREMARNLQKGGYLYFKNGASSFTDAIVAQLRSNPNVDIKLGEPVKSIALDASLKVTITTEKGGKPAMYDKAISTVFARTLADMTDGVLPSLAQSEAVTLQVVNLWYPKPLLNAPHHGFGYLIPQTVPFENNPESVLGVLFDSDRDLFGGEPRPDAVPGTSLTVMMGGHLWDGLPASFRPDAESAIELAKSAVARQLGIPATEPVYAGTKACQMCIPQHRVGHFARMARAHRELQSAFRGRLMVAGTSYAPPGVLTSLRSARDAADQVLGTWRSDDESPWVASIGDTGLQRFLPGRRRWVPVKRSDLPLRNGNF